MFMVESVRRISLPRYTVKVWRAEDASYKHAIGGFCELDLEAHKHQDLPMEDLASLLLSFPRVVQVEILDWDHNGMVIQNPFPAWEDDA